VFQPGSSAEKCLDHHAACVCTTQMAFEHTAPPEGPIPPPADTNCPAAKCTDLVKGTYQYLRHVEEGLVLSVPCQTNKPTSTLSLCSTVNWSGKTTVSSCNENMCYAKLAEDKYVALHECTGAWSVPAKFRLKLVPAGQTNVDVCAESKHVASGR